MPDKTLCKYTLSFGISSSLFDIYFVRLQFSVFSHH